MRDITEQIENNGQVQTSAVNQTIQRLQQIQKQFQTIQPLLSAVGHELAELEVAGLPKSELQTIQNSYEAHRQRLTTYIQSFCLFVDCFDYFRYEHILQKRLDLLKRFEEHLKRSNEVRAKLQQINQDLQQKPQLKLHDIDQLKAQLERCITDLRTIQSESSILDRLMEESNTTIIDSTTNRTIFFTVESRNIQSLVDTVENKVSLCN